MASAEAQLRSLADAGRGGRDPFEGAVPDPFWSAGAGIPSGGSPGPSPGADARGGSPPASGGDGDPSDPPPGGQDTDVRLRELEARWGAASPRPGSGGEDHGGHGGHGDHGEGEGASEAFGSGRERGRGSRDRELGQGPGSADPEASARLLEALAGGDAARASEELRRGADLQARTGQERVIHIAVRFACRTGDTRALERLLRAPGGREALKSVNAFGETPLHEAAASGSMKVVLLLMRHGASPLARDRAGRTPQMLAFARGHGPVAEELAKRVMRSPGASRADRRDALAHLSEGGRERVSRHASLQADAGRDREGGWERSL